MRITDQDNPDQDNRNDQEQPGMGKEKARMICIMRA
jgi:hypothetical protein